MGHFMVGHPESVKSKILNYFKFPPLTKLIEKTKIPKIWRSSLFSLESCFFFLFLWDFRRKLRFCESLTINSDGQFQITYSISCSQFLRMFSRLAWLYGKVNCKIFEKSIKKRKCILFRIFNLITFFNPNSLRKRLKRKTVNLFPSNSRSTAFKTS